MNDQSKSIKRAAAAIVVILVGVLIYAVIQNQRFHLIGTNPSMSSVATISPFIKLNYNKVIDAKSVSISASDSSVSGQAVQGKTIILTLNPLTKGKTYTINIRRVSSISGSSIYNQNLSFVPKFIDYNDLPADQREAIMKKQAGNSKVKSDPILGHLPYGNADFRLSGIVSGNPPAVTIKAELLLSAADAKTDANAAAAKYKQEVIDYIESLGLKPESYNINFVVVMPSLY